MEPAERELHHRSTRVAPLCFVVLSTVPASVSPACLSVPHHQQAGLVSRLMAADDVACQQDCETPRLAARCAVAAVKPLFFSKMKPDIGLE